MYLLKKGRRRTTANSVFNYFYFLDFKLKICLPVYPKIENLEYWKTQEQNKQPKALLTHPVKMPFFFFFLCLEFLKTIWNFSIKIQDRLPQFYMKSSRFPFRDTQSKQTTMVTFHDETVFQKGFHASTRSWIESCLLWNWQLTNNSKN